MISRLQELPIGDRYRRAEIHFGRGMLSLARDDFESLLATGHGLPADLEAELRWRLAVCHVGLGRADDADAVLDAGFERPGLDDRALARFESVRGYAALSRGDYPRARDVLEKACASLRQTRDRAGLAPALRWLAQTHLRTGRLEPAFEAAYCSLAETRDGALDADAASSHGVLCVAFIQRGQYDAAVEHGKEALAISTRLGHQAGITRNNLHLSIAVRLAGDLDAAAQYALRALASAEESDAKNLVISARLAASRALRESGRLEAARELAEGALAIARSSERERDHVLVLEDLGDLDHLAGRTRQALEKYRQAWRRAETIAAEGDLVAELGWRIGAAQLDLGDVEGARAWIERSLLVAEKAGERKEQALALRARGTWHARNGREAEARQDFEGALAMLEDLRVPFEIARTQLAYEAALQECGSDTRAVRDERCRHLAAARGILERIGAANLLRHVEAAELRLSEAGAGAVVHAGATPRGARLLEAGWASPAFRAALEECRKLGPTSLPLLLLGETGTGKSLLAEALHHLGRAAEGEFFPVNCAAMPEHLQESELFGHRKGAFTGAEREHPGIFREAGRGTVFLDEIDKTTREFQAKLLHVLDSREVRPVGSTRPVAVGARIVCATNRDLDRLVAEGRFLEDLHHRLLGGAVQVPPLRDRLDDLRLLVGVILDEICAVERAARPTLDDDAWQVLSSHDWPGNVRELKTLLHRAVALHRDVPTLRRDMILASAPAGSTLRGKPVRAAVADLSQRMASAERDEILRALEKAGGVRRRAAEILGISYRGLGKKMVRLGIRGTRGAGRREASL